MTARPKLIALLLPCVLAAGVCHAEDTVWKWKDDKGRWQYGNQPPQGVKAEKVTATISTVPAIKSQPRMAPQPDPAPAADAASQPKAVTSAGRQQMMEACEKAGGTDCDAVVNAALNAMVEEAAKRPAP
ncbi:hypothetical protein GCM10025771_22210 [Niveibacterium umoris]|uniref:DUF4124 domain-containing protein n=1 Tax=Niveibacterium umoris TaxID=1193620 RepID=A0A840BHY5_9RHOO|nr:DUF4124 domain-containing protein [Niveibacterium umoris]MBB4012590.1 hypothetical protein [Niveibacterium umoris]